MYAADSYNVSQLQMGLGPLMITGRVGHSLVTYDSGSSYDVYKMFSYFL